MPAPHIRVDHDALKRIASLFYQQAEAIGRTEGTLQSNVQTLQDGDWIGVGARKFYAEMTSIIFPSLRHLGDALLESSRSMIQISKTMHRADEAAARLLGHEMGMFELLTGGLVRAIDATVDKIIEDVRSVDMRLAKFDPKVRELVKKSPTLRRQIENLPLGWRIEIGPPGSNDYYCDWDNEKILIRHGVSAETQVRDLAHEVGHAVTGKPPYHKPTKGMTKAEYLKLNLDERRISEGHAQFNAAIVRDEIRKAGGPDIRIPGTQTTDYQRVYDDFKKGNITRQEAIEDMGYLMDNERPAGSSTNYRNYYKKEFERDWAREVGTGRTKA